MIDGIVDLSHWESPVNFAAMKTAGTLAVILKATQGSNFIDPTFSIRAAQASMAGLLVGAYHFADGTDPTIQADLFLRVAGGWPVLAIDLEVNDTTGGTVSIVQAAELVSIIQSVAGRLPLCYIDRYGIDGRSTGLPNSVLSRCPLWLSEYGNKPIPPPGWTEPLLWQWTDEGLCSGVGGMCDLNRFNGSVEQLTAFWSKQ